jgi:hypothetical protein
MLTTIENSFRLFANAVYSVYVSQRRIESLAPQTLFFQGIPFEPSELQKSFRYVGVKPPEISPLGVQRTVFLDEGFKPYKALLEGKATEGQAEEGREEYWAAVISQNLGTSGKSLIRAGANHVSAGGLLGTFRGRRTGRLPILLRKSGIEIQVIDRVADVNKVFGK